MMRLIFLPLILTATLSAQETAKQTSAARLWLKVPAAQSPLRDIQVSSGTATPAGWEQDPAARERHTDVIFPVRWWDWREFTISFTPVEDGSVEMILSGPWEEEKPGTAVRKEVLWDDLTAEGTQLTNGGFEAQQNGKPDSWKPIFGDYLAADAWPLAKSEARQGKFLAATWQDRPLAQTLQLKAGQKVTLKLHAKAATLPGFVPPKRLGQDTPAHRAVAKIKRGMNLGNCWEAPPPYSWGVRYTPEDIDRIAAQGFDHIRVPVAWTYHLKQSADGLEIDQLRLPDGDDRIAVTVHCYEPFYFTHQGAHWVKLRGLRGMTYPGPPATPFALPDSLKENAGIRDFIERYNTLPTDRNSCSAVVVRELLDLAREWSVNFGRPVHLGEFGSNNTGDQASRERYSRDVRKLAEARGIPWALWDWKATFGFWDTKNNQPLFRAGLFD